MPEWFAIFVAAASLFVFPSLAADPGLGWHLRTGQLLREEQGLLGVDRFLWPPSDAPYLLNQWLAQVAAAWVFSWGGWAALHSMTYLLVWSAHLILPLLLLHTISCSRFGSAPREGFDSCTIGLNPVVGLAALLAPVLMGSLQWMIRPQVISFLLFGFLLLLVRLWNEERLSTRTVCFIVLPLFALWANCHPGFLVGLLVLLVAVGAALLRGSVLQAMRALGATSVAFAATFFTPHGGRLYTASIGLVSDPYFMRTMTEWMPISFDVFFLPFWISLVVLIAGAGVHLVGRRFARAEGQRVLFDWLLAFGLGVLALEHRRFLPFFGVAAVVPLALSIDALLRTAGVRSRCEGTCGERRQIRPLTGALFGVLLFLCAMSWVRTPFEDRDARAFSHYFPWDASQALTPVLDPRAVNPLRTLNNPNWGGMLTFMHWPALRVFADDRNEVNGRKRYEDYFSMMRATPEGLRLFSQLDFDAVLMAPERPLMKYLAGREDYVKLFSSPEAEIFVRRSLVNADLLRSSLVSRHSHSSTGP